MIIETALTWFFVGVITGAFFEATKKYLKYIYLGWSIVCIVLLVINPELMNLRFNSDISNWWYLLFFPMIIIGQFFGINLIRGKK